MDKKIPQLFFETIRYKLAFLVTEYAYTGPYSNLDSYTTYTFSVWYKRTNLAIEFDLEIRDEVVDCYIARLVDGEMPDGGFMNERGERIRIRLSQWIRGVSNQKNLFTKVTGLSLEERIPIQIDDYVNLLQKYGQMFLEDNPSIFSRRQ